MADQTFKSTDKSGAPSNPGSASHGFEKVATAAAAAATKSVTEQVKVLPIRQCRPAVI